MSSSKSPSSEYVHVEDCSQQLRERINQAAKDVREDAMKATTKPATKLSATDSCKIIFAKFYNSVIPKIVEGTPPSQILNPRGKYTSYQPEVMVILAGQFSIGAQRLAVMICLFTEGIVKLEVNGTNGGLTDVFCKTGSIIYVAGGSELHTSGEGRIVCIFLGFERK